MFSRKSNVVEEELFTACSIQDLTLVAQCMKKGADINKVCSSGRTPLGLAAEIGNVDIIKVLLGLESTQVSTTPPTCSKSNLGYFVMVHSESNENIQSNIHGDDLNRGFNVDEFNDALIQRFPGIPDVGSLFDHADSMPDLEWDSEIEDSLYIDTEHDPMTENYFWYASILSQTGSLLAEGPSFNSIDGEDKTGMTALHYAAAAGHLSAITILLEAGCKINAEDSDNFTPLHLASSKEGMDVVEFLLSKGANPYHRSTDGVTPLHVAASWGLLSNVQTLISFGANVNAVDICDRTPLYLAVSRRKHAVVRHLIEKGAKVNMEEIHGYTPLYEAVCSKDVDLVEQLLVAGSKVTQSHHLLHYAVLHRQEEMVKVLVKAGSIVNLRNEAGDTPLMLAVRTQFLNIVKLLLCNGAMVHLINHVSRQTALLDAINGINRDCNSFSAMFSLLEDFGLNWKEERTALSFAVMSNNDHAVVTLVRRWHILTDERLQDKSEIMTRLLLRDKRMLVELFVNAGYDIQAFKCNAAYAKADWFATIVMHPLSLQQLARISIRSALKTNIYKKLKKIPLPQLLKKYILLEDMPCSCEASS